MSELKRRRKERLEGVDLEEFKALVNNLIPTTLEQAESICSIVERLTHEHPELKEKFEEWCKMPESEERELKEIIRQSLLRERTRQKW